MPGGNVSEESLEQRIERIRKRDEEIEKRHREAEADRLAALQANAMVKTTAPADDDWPKAHKYDTVDFTYDVKTEDADTDDKKSDVSRSDETKLPRPFKKFPEGQGPPADPTYNFLADDERDGKQAGVVTNDNKNWRVNTNSNTPTANNRRNNGGNSSFRGRNGGKTKNTSPKSKDEPILRKSDQDRNKEQRLQRQTSSEGMWRRTDDKKVDAKDGKNSGGNSPTGKKPDNRSPNSKSDGSPSKSKASVQQRINVKSDNELQQKVSDLSIEKRGNITMSVTKDGEVKSVKLEAARSIGSGRVGGTSGRVQPQQQFSNPPVEANLNPALNYSTFDQFKTHQPQMRAPQAAAPQVVPQVASPPISPPIINGVPFKLPSVQDRLIKNRVFFDGNLKNVAQTGNIVGGKQ